MGTQSQVYICLHKTNSNFSIKNVKCNSCDALKQIEYHAICNYRFFFETQKITFYIMYQIRKEIEVHI